MVEEDEMHILFNYGKHSKIHDSFSLKKIKEKKAKKAHTLFQFIYVANIIDSNITTFTHLRILS